jgi:hypothetical protein
MGLAMESLWFSLSTVNCQLAVIDRRYELFVAVNEREPRFTWHRLTPGRDPGPGSPDHQS